MEFIDNINLKLKDSLKEAIKEGSKLDIAAPTFSFYAYEAIKEELEGLNEFRFIFTSPTFLEDESKKEKKMFYIPKLEREKSLYGTEYELRLKNELTQKSISKECAEWIERKATFKSNISNGNIVGMINVDKDSTYMPINGFTTVELGDDKGNNIYYPINKFKGDEEIVSNYQNAFNELWNDDSRLEDVTEKVIKNLSQAYQENSPEYIYFFTLYNIFNEFLENLTDDELPNEATGYKDSKVWNSLYDFQKDGVKGIINKLEKYNGCILADSVGLGKTFTALGVIKYYESRNRNVLVLCPKKLSENWNTYKNNYKNNPLLEDRLRYDVLYHTDLSREKGMSNNIDLAKINWGNYDLVVIDESHNFRNGSSTHKEKNNRYDRLMKNVIKGGVKTKVLMLSATPVNNRFRDLKNQLALAYEGDSDNINKKLKTESDVEVILRSAQQIFNAWVKLDVEDRTQENLITNLDFDFFELLDSVTIARSRKHIEKYYNSKDIGTFPKKRPPISLRPALTDLDNAINYTEIFEILSTLNLAIYTPSLFIFASRRYLYEDEDTDNLTMSGREKGIQRLMTTNLLKRLESSVYSFRITLEKVYFNIKNTLEAIKEYDEFRISKKVAGISEVSEDEVDYDDLNDDMFTVGRNYEINLDDIDYKQWEKLLIKDKETLEILLSMVKDIKPEYDLKLAELKEEIKYKVNNPMNPGNKKILIFTAFADTATYLYDNLAETIEKEYGLNTALITGSKSSKTTIKKLGADFNTILTLFSPDSKSKDLIYPNIKEEIDILIATDVISEGQNLQDCDYVINYDIHWNPVRIIQRFGRVDRIGSKNKEIQLVNFWPDMELDDYIKLKNRVETRMAATIMTSTGDDNPLEYDDDGDLEFRKKQLRKLQEEVVDLEDMNTGISIMDLGLNEYRLDLLNYIESGVDFNKTPTGIHTVVEKTDENSEGIIFVLKNINDEINRDNQNRIHPFYMVYISKNREILVDYLNPRKLLDTTRLLSKGYKNPIEEKTTEFNKMTGDGKNMKLVSELLEESIKSIISTKEESDIDSLFKPGGTSALESVVSGLDDFELITFYAVM